MSRGVKVSIPKIKRKRFYNSLDLSLISWQMADFLAEKYEELTYILKNKASRKKTRSNEKASHYSLYIGKRR